MREIKIPNVSQKRTDNLERYLIQLIDDGKPTPLDKSVNYRAFITYDGSLVTPAGIELTIQDNQLVLDSAKLDLPAGIYRFEIWAEKDGQRAIYPDSGMKRLVINANATDLPNGTVTSLTLDEFVKEFKNLVKDVGNSSNPNQGGSIEASIDTDKRTITINGKSLTIPEPVDLSGLASKDDIAGLVKQTELAEYVKKNDLPSIPNMTDYVKKEELPKQPDLAKYALKSDLPDLTGYAKMSDLPNVTELVKKSELANYAKKSDLPVIPDLTPFLKTADADKKFATKSEIPSLDGYAKKEEIPNVVLDTNKRTITINNQTLTIPPEIDLSNIVTDKILTTKLTSYATKDDLKTVTSNATRHAPTGWTLDRTTNPWIIWFDNSCGLQISDYATMATIYGYGFSVNIQNTGLEAWPLIGGIMSASRGTLTLDAISKLHGYADYWGPNTTVINPVRTDADDYDWNNVYFNDEDRAKSDDYHYNRQRNLFRVMYELGIWSIEDIKPFGLIKKEG